MKLHQYQLAMKQWIYWRNFKSVLYDQGKIRIHKIAPNCIEAITQFPLEDLDKNLDSINIGMAELLKQ